MTSPDNKFDPSTERGPSRPPSRRRWRTFLLVGIWVGGIATIGMKHYVYPFLACSYPSEHPDALIVEGWLPYQALQTVFEHTQVDTNLLVIVTGASRGHTVFTLGGHPQSEWTSQVDKLPFSPLYPDSLFVSVSGNLIQGSSGHMQVQVNGNWVGDFTVPESFQDFALALPQKGFGPVQRVSLRMDNTYILPREGIRQIYIQRVALDSFELPLFGPHTFYSFSSGSQERFEVSQEENVAVVAGKILEQMGLPKRRLVVLPYEAKQGARTLEGAKTVGEWIQNTDYPSQSIHLYSQAAHARRSFEMYKKTLPNNVQLGVSALPDYRYDENWMSHPVGRRLVCEQLLKYLFYKIVFIR